MPAAPARFRIDLLGDKALEKALRELPAKTERRLLRKGMREAFKITKDAILAETPVKHGTLRRSIKLRAGKSRRGLLQFRIFTGGKEELGIPANAKRGGPTGFYPMALEAGYTRGGTRTTGTRLKVYRTKTGKIRYRRNKYERVNGGVAIPTRKYIRGPLHATEGRVLAKLRPCSAICHASVPTAPPHRPAPASGRNSFAPPMRR